MENNTNNTAAADLRKMMGAAHPEYIALHEATEAARKAWKAVGGHFNGSPEYMAWKKADDAQGQWIRDNSTWIAC